MNGGRRFVRSGSPYEATIGFSRAVRIGNRIWVSGTAPTWPEGTVDPDAGVQADRVFDIIDVALRELGGSLDDVVRTRMFVSARAHAHAVGEVHARRVGHVSPTATMVVTQLLDERWCVEIEVDACVEEAGTVDACVEEAGTVDACVD